MRKRTRWLAVLAMGVALVPASIAAYFLAGALARPRPARVAGTEHASLSRESCLACHAPIAEEWRASFHHRSVTGPFWERIRTRGFDDLFDALRVPCMSCHAPANVVDLAPAAHPTERLERPELGVDCVSCHVSERGIVGPGRFADAPHEVLPDARFADPTRASTTLCASCHEECGPRTPVQEWQASRFAREGVTCLHCHMPEVDGPIVAGGPSRRRRSHAFPADKIESVLREALNARVEISPDRRAVVRITNDRVGHSFPAAGTNALRVRLRVLDLAGRVAMQAERSFGTIEWIPGYLDFWPFRQVTKIPPGETRELAVPLPAGHGSVRAELHYRDWFAIEDQDVWIRTLTTAY